MGDLDMWLAKVELHIADGEEKLEEMDNRIKELNGRLDEFREEVQVTFNATIDKPTSESESTRHTLTEDIATLHKENCFLRKELDRVLARLRDVDDEMVIMKRAIAQGGVASPSTLPLAMPSKVEVPKQSSFKGSRNAKKLIISYGVWSNTSKLLASTRMHGRSNMPHFILQTIQWFSGGGDMRTSIKGGIHDYVKEFSEVLLEIPNYLDGEALFAFMDDD
ncbi:hypothetical protein GH714_002749 [Hevea brasiliensis]|uniref:Uncharacterized protein n=1 Tax=Hevea brasiliensis TaxID=3981 RepID=A0A6A6KHK7_HEVBR|nr:hypothetical protein GH714_002749 [Hevea brasiliensis]